MPESHERAADAAEAELADMERRSDALEDDIESTRADWEAKKADPAVPGAGGDPDAAGPASRPRPTSPAAARLPR